MIHPPALRASAQALADPLPALLAAADQLAATVILGDHGRRRPGLGDTFWQYRAAQPGDAARSIDWRRSARSDDNFVQDREWQIAQSVMLWVDTSAAMRFASQSDLPSKAQRARVLALATAILLARGGERIGLAGTDLTPKRGMAQLELMAAALVAEDSADYGLPDLQQAPLQSRAVLISDFLGDLTGLETAMSTAAGRGIGGVMVQILDPAETSFPYDGRTIFESVGGTLRHETRKAGDLRDRYLLRLAERRDKLAQMAQAAGWQFHPHQTDGSAQAALLWIYGAMGQGR